jgi:hypothetical protein
MCRVASAGGLCFVITGSGVRIAQPAPSYHDLSAEPGTVARADSVGAQRSRKRDFNFDRNSALVVIAQ